MGHWILIFYDLASHARVIANFGAAVQGTFAAQIKQEASGTTCTN